MSTLPPAGLPSSKFESGALGAIPPPHGAATGPNQELRRSYRHPLALTPAMGAGIAACLAVVGLALIWSTVLSLWSLWTTDALKSIGMAIPVVSFLLVLRAWRGIGWEMSGTWWGFALLVFTALLVRLRDQTILVLVLAPQWSMFFPPHSLVIFAFGVGVALLFGGTRLVRAAVFPLVLLLFSNPIPHVFNVYVDLPLQRASAHVARSFAMALGQPLTPDKLRLMFTPSFGMFIAPGCNGIRGAVTMGFIALIAGYLYRFRWKAHAAVVVGAIALGYLFNLLRLCVLVLYYIVALHFTGLQGQGENADYVIGAVLFFLAVFLLYTVIQRLGRSTGSVHEAKIREAGVRERASVLPSSFFPRAAAMTVLAVMGIGLLIQVLRAPGPSPQLAADEHAMGQFPQTAGAYTLVDTWNETLLTGPLLFHWAEYAPTDAPGRHIAIGISPVLGSHDTLICHSARGEDPLWRGQQTMATSGAGPVNFSTALYNDGAKQYIEATTLCNGTSCGEYSTAPAHLGLVWSKPHPESLLSQNPERPIPILIKAETTDTTLPAVVARQQLSADVSAFLAGVDLDRLTQPYRRH